MAGIGFLILRTNDKARVVVLDSSAAFILNDLLFLQSKNSKFEKFVVQCPSGWCAGEAGDP